MSYMNNGKQKSKIKSIKPMRIDVLNVQNSKLL